MTCIQTSHPSPPGQETKDPPALHAPGSYSEWSIVEDSLRGDVPKLTLLESGLSAVEDTSHQDKGCDAEMRGANGCV